MTIYLLLALLALVSEACIYSQSYWLSNVSEPWPTSPLLSQPLCGLSWYKLMHLNTSQTREEGPMHYLLAFHQLCTACLNMCKEESGGSFLPSSVKLSIAVIFDSMQRYCDNMQGWVREVERDSVLAANLKTLIVYNHGENVCDPVLFSFSYEPQLFFLGYNETQKSEMARQVEEREGLYRRQSLLTLSFTVAVFVILALIIYAIMLYNRKRDYTFFRTSHESETFCASGPEGALEELESFGDDDDANAVYLHKEKAM